MCSVCFSWRPKNRQFQIISVDYMPEIYYNEFKIDFMTGFLKRNILPAVVFITGASVLIVEVVAIRILAPYYGNTIFTVSSVISIILAALSVGYYTGGALADRHPSRAWFFSIILLSGLGLLLFHFVGTIALPLLSLTFSLAAGPLVSSALLFFLPALLLGTLSPYAVKLQSVSVPTQGVGSVAGKIFFWSTLGSIIGSLLAGFVLIPSFGINQIVIANGVMLFFLGFIPLVALGTAKKHLHKFLFAFVIVAVAAALTTQYTNGNIVYGKDGVYEKITIYDGEYNGRPARFFQQDRSSSGAMFLDSSDPTDLAYGYSKYYSLYKIFTPDVGRVLIIGSGASSILKAMLAELPDAAFDVSEIEPSLFDLAKKYFRVVDTPRLHNYVEDGRRLLRDEGEKYDVIFSDVASSLFSIPAHFATQEFFTIAKNKLNNGGIFIANIIGDLSRQQPSFTMSEIKTLQTVFPNSYFFAVESPEKTDSQNIILVGFNSDKKIDLDTSSLANYSNPTIRSLGSKVLDVGRLELAPYPVLTDNFSPVEYLAAQALKNYAGFEKAFRLKP
jgi:spermidine synthase